MGRPSMARAKRLKALATVAGLGLLAVSCATLGTPFRFSGLGDIVVGKTDKAALLAEFGGPTRVGYDSGSEKWAYGYYHYSVFGVSRVKELDVVFDQKGLVSSYTYESSDPAEIRKQMPAGAGAPGSPSE